MGGVKVGELMDPPHIADLTSTGVKSSSWCWAAFPR